MARAQPRVGDQQLQRLDELVAVRVVQAGVAPGQCSTSTSLRALASTGVPTAKDFERQQRQALVRRGHDDHRRGLERLQPLLRRRAVRRTG